MASNPVTTVFRLAATMLAARAGELAAVLHATVHAGASVSFVLPFTIGDAERFWREPVLAGVRAGTRAVFVAEAAGQLVGTVQLDWATPPNQPHRADVAKLLVHPEHRRRGTGRALMAALESDARARGRTLLTLDTRTGSAAEPLYERLGYTRVGLIPNYSVDPRAPAQLDATTIFYKSLGLAT